MGEEMESTEDVATDEQVGETPEELTEETAEETDTEVEEEDQQAAGDEEPADEETATDETDETDDEEQEEKPAPKRKRKNGLSERFRELTSQKKALKARLDEAEKRLSRYEETDPAPKEDDFDDEDVYFAKQREWEVRKQVRSGLREETEREAKEANDQIEQTATELFVARAEEFKTVAPDFDAVAYSTEAPMSPVMREAILESNHGPALAYHLGSNIDVAQRIASLPPVSAALELGRLEAKLASSPPRTKPVTKAPPPVGARVKGRKTTRVDENSMSIDEWMAYRNKQVHGR